MLRNVEAIKKMGYKVIVSNASNLNGILDVISVTGIISGKKDEAEKLKTQGFLVEFALGYFLSISSHPKL